MLKAPAAATSFFPGLPGLAAVRTANKERHSPRQSQHQVNYQQAEGPFSGHTRKTQAAGLSVSAVIPPAARSAFPFDFFNPMQSKSFDAVFNTADNVLVSAPTSSGKTALLELAVVRQVLVHGDLHKPAGQRGKTVYLAPMRAIVDEVASDWSNKFQSLGLRVISLLSSESPAGSSDAEALQQADIVCATPEKWDAITRTWKANKALMGQVSLLLLDEVHFVGDERGAVLEAIVSRMAAVQRDADTVAAQWPAVSLRTVALSATLPNVHSMSQWLSAKHVLQFGDEYRPVPLRVSVLGFGNTRAGKEFLHEQGLNKRVFGVIQEHSMGKPSLVFCPTRRGTHAVAKQLCLDSRLAAGGGGSSFVTSAQHQQQLTEAAQQCSDPNLRECIAQGVGFHTAGLSASDRGVVERAFRGGMLSALATTTTLSQGVNLPAHLVVVKSTMQWKGSARGGYQQYDLSTVLQMIGRAGRPQYDDSGAAVIMTETQTKDLYQRMSSGALSVQSFLKASLVEYLNTEVALGTVQSLQQALQWLQTTFLWHCVKSDANEAMAKAALQQSVAETMQLLTTKGFVKMADGQANVPAERRALLPCLPCLVASKHALSVATVEHIIRAFVPHLLGSDGSAAVAGQASVSEEFFWYTVCHCQEFSRAVRLRQGDKKQLNALLRSKTTRWGLSGNRVKSLEEKVFVLVQLKLAGTNPGSYDLQMDARACVDMLSRIAKAMVSILSSDEVCSSLVVYAHTMYRSALHSMWSSDPLPLRQLESLRRHFKKLGDLNICSVADLVRLHESDLKDLVKLPANTVAAASEELGGLVPVEADVFARKQPHGRMWDVVIKATAAVPHRLGSSTLSTPAWAHGWWFWLLDAEGRLVAKLRVRRYDDAELVVSVPEDAVMNNLSLCVQHANLLSMDILKPVRLQQASSSAANAQRAAPADVSDIFGLGAQEQPPTAKPAKRQTKPAKQHAPKRPARAQSDIVAAFARAPKKPRATMQPGQLAAARGTPQPQPPPATPHSTAAQAQTVHELGKFAFGADEEGQPPALRAAAQGTSAALAAVLSAPSTTLNPTSGDMDSLWATLL